MKQIKALFGLTAIVIFSFFALTAHATQKKDHLIHVTYEWLGHTPRYNGGYDALIKASPDQRITFSTAAAEQIATQTGLEGDGDSIAAQIAKQLADKSAKAVIIPAGTTMSYMGSGKGTVFGQFVLAEPLAGHAFELKLMDAGQKKYVGTLRVFDKCANDLPLEFSAVPDESPRPEPPVKKASILFEGGYRNDVNGAHQRERGYIGIGTKVGEKTRVYVGGGFIGSQVVDTMTITTCH